MERAQLLEMENGYDSDGDAAMASLLAHPAIAGMQTCAVKQLFLKNSL